MKKGLALFFIFATMYACADAQPVHVLNLKNGLSNNYIQCVLQDRMGYIWLGTRDGLNRYDGHDVTTYRQELPSTFVYSLLQDANGKIWIGTSRGMTSFDPEKETFEQLSPLVEKSEALSTKDIYTLYEDRKRRLWIGTLQGLACLDAGRAQVSWYAATGIRGDHAITAICEDPLGNLFAGTSLGLFALSNNELKRTTRVPGQETLFIRDIKVEDNNKWWIATDDKGIYSITATGEIKHYTIPKGNTGTKNAQIWRLYIDNKGIVWAALINGGIMRYNKASDKFEKYGTDFYVESVAAVLEDTDGNFWIASQGDGAYYFNPQRYVFERYLDGTAEKKPFIVASLLEDVNNKLWIGTDGDGLLVLSSDGKLKKSFTNDGLSSNIILDIIEDDHHGKWLATWQGGINYISPAGKVKSFNTLRNNNIKALQQDGEGNIWAASHGDGIYLYGAAAKRFLDPTTIGLPLKPGVAQWGSDIMTARNGDTWIASHAGLYRISNSQITQYHADGTPHALSSAMIYCLFEDSNGSVWVGSNIGLEKYIPEKDGFENYSVLHGVPENIKCIVEDKEKNLWISTVNQIVSLSLTDLRLQYFDKSYNLQEGQFYECSCMKSATGKLYFGGTEGFNAFYPDSISSKVPSSRVFIHELYLFNKKQGVGEPGSALDSALAIKKMLQLDYDQNVVSLAFIDLNYGNVEKRLYRYKMNGFDKDWSPTTESRTATYTNLDPGTYLFQVQSMGLAGHVLSEDVLLVKIVPPFWMETWFSVVSVAVVTCLVVGFFLFRLGASKRQRLMLQNVVNERTKEVNDKNVLLQDLNATKDRLFSIIAHDLRNPFTSLIGFAQLLHTESERHSEEERQKLIKRMYHSSATIYALLENLLVWSKSQQNILTFSPERLSFQNVIREHFDLIEDEAEKKNIRLTIVQNNDVTFFADRNMLSVILRNLLSNALKYSPIGGEIQVVHRVINGGLVVSVLDEGIGLAGGAPFVIKDEKRSHRDHNHGLGLILCTEFVEKHGGSITATNNPVRGACFEFTLPNSNAEIVESDEQTLAGLYKAVPSPEDAPQRPGVGTRPVVLIAEDDDQVRWYIKQILFPEFKVIEAINGDDAMTLLASEIPDLIMSDMVMPGVDGLSFCKHVKVNASTSHIPFIMLTAERGTDKKINGYQFGADDFITKPIEPNVLRVRLHNILENRKRLMAIYQKDITAAPEVFTSNSVDQLFLEKLNAIIENQMTNPELNPDHLAREVHMSRTGLYTKVKALTGESVGIYIRNVRLKHSKTLLRERKLNISEVAYAVGFNQLPYFTTCFKEAFGITPSEYQAGKEK